MPTLNISVPHQLTQDEALRRIQDTIAQAKIQYAGKVTISEENWSGYAGTFTASGSGQTVSGSIAVNPSDVTIQSSLPFAAILFKGRIQSGVRDKLTTILS
jgi:hypothetical protein